MTLHGRFKECQSRSYVTTDGLSSCRAPRQISITVNSRFVDVGRPLWREDGSLVFNCWWFSPPWSFSCPILRDSWSYFTASGLIPPKPWGQFLFSYMPPGTGWPTYAPGAGFRSRRLLQLAGSRWRYSKPAPHGARRTKNTFLKRCSELTWYSVLNWSLLLLIAPPLFSPECWGAKSAVSHQFPL
jgi:hypothetical protein